MAKELQRGIGAATRRRGRVVGPLTVLLIAGSGLVGVGVFSSGAPADATTVASEVATRANALGAGGVPVCASTHRSVLKPTPGFDPMTASTSELDAQDFPDRPTNAGDLPAWRQYVDWYLAGEIIVCPDDVSVPASLLPPGSAAGANPGWDGEELHNASYTDMQTQFTVHQATGGTDDFATFWAGVNSAGTFTNPIIQAGAEVDGAGHACDLFYMAYGRGNIASMAACTYGNLIDVHVTMSSSGLAAWNVNNVSKGIVYPRSASFSGTTLDGHAEAIAERLCENPDCTIRYALANFGTQNFALSKGYSASSGTQYIGTTAGSPPYCCVDEWITNSAGQTMAYTPYYDTMGNFPAIWQRRL